ATLVVLLLSFLVTEGAEGQRLRFSITGGSPITFPNPTEAHYDAGSVPASSAALGWTENITGGGNTNRTSIVSVRANSSVMGGTKPIGDLQWKRSDLAVWNSLTTSNVVVESRPIRNNGINDPWSNSMTWRVLLDWANDGPATYTPTVVVTSTLTTP
ncbi:MAG TPA: hypothetical protein VG712_01940, partial [Gemmatimonadales bacterium]|nr:hypothetical protein [Gemmatimonadales bacterium]